MSKNNAYTGGLFDGEGTVSLMRTHKNGHRVPFIEMASTSIELLDYLRLHYGGTIVKKKTYKSHHKTSWSWRLTNRKALAFIEEIRPHMLESLKQARCDLILLRYLALTPRNGKYTARQLEAKIEFASEFFAL